MFLFKHLIKKDKQKKNIKKMKSHSNSNYPSAISPGFSWSLKIKYWKWHSKKAINATLQILCVPAFVTSKTFFLNFTLKSLWVSKLWQAAATATRGCLVTHHVSYFGSSCSTADKSLFGSSSHKSQRFFSHWWHHSIIPRAIAERCHIS